MKWFGRDNIIRYKYIALVGLVVMAFLTGCHSKKGNKSSLFGAIGKPLEMVVVIPDGYDTEAMRDSIRTAFAFAMPSLPQYEPMISVMMTGEANFSQMFKSMRNILYLTIDSERYTKPGIGISRNQFADEQLLIHARAESLESLYKLLHLKSEYMGNLVHREEIQRLAKSFESTYSSKVAKLVEETIGGWTINVANELGYTNREKDFLWASDQGSKGRTDLMVYTYPYKGEISLSPASIIAARDSVLKRNVAGQYEGSYMTTEKRLDPVVKRFELNGSPRMELRGLWAMVGDMMGGPYVLHALYDEAKGRVVVAEMLVYNPSGKKKNLMLYAESQLYTFRPAGTSVTSHKAEE